MLQVYKGLSNNSPANHPSLQHQGLNCKGRSSDGIGRMHMKGASGGRQTVMHDPGAQHLDQKASKT